MAQHTVPLGHKSHGNVHSEHTTRTKGLHYLGAGPVSIQVCLPACLPACLTACTRSLILKGRHSRLAGAEGASVHRTSNQCTAEHPRLLLNYYVTQPAVDDAQMLSSAGSRQELYLVVPYSLKSMPFKLDEAIGGALCARLWIVVGVSGGWECGLRLQPPNIPVLHSCLQAA